VLGDSGPSIHELVNTMLRFIMLCCGLIGLGLGAEYGAKLFGIIGGIAGALACGYLGLRLGCAPTALVLTMISVELGRMSVEELRASLRRKPRYIPNFVLLELQGRGEDIEQHLPVVLNLLRSEDVTDRSRGLAALRTAFPALADRIPDYRIGGPIESCRADVDKLTTLA
jgi:hypothetical protein